MFVLGVLVGGVQSMTIHIALDVRDPQKFVTTPTRVVVHVPSFT